MRFFKRGGTLRFARRFNEGEGVFLLSLFLVEGGEYEGV